MYRVKLLHIQSCSAMLPALQSFKNASKIHLQCVGKLKKSYASSCIARSSISWPSIEYITALPSQQCSSGSTAHNFNSRTAADRTWCMAPSITAQHFLSPCTIIGQSHQHRNYSSFTDYCRQVLIVKAAEPVTESSIASADKTASITSPTNLTDGVEYIPLPPVPLPGGLDPSTLTALGEPSLSSLGLGGYYPVGLMQSALEMIHVNLGLPWWGSIALLTVIMRLLLFPVVVVAQRNAAKLSNVSPQMQVIQIKITDARQSGDQLQVSRYTNELMMFMKEKNVNPLKSMVVVAAQAPVFISMFVGLRRCANLPVASMTMGGMLWFTDLTIADPYYLLPVLTCATMYLTIELGTEMGRMQAAGENARLMFTAMRFMPLIIFPFMINFPSALLCYWLTTNLMSLGQAGLLRIPAVRTYFNIEQLVKHSPTSLPLTEQQNKKSTIQAAKDSWRNMQVTRELADRKRYDEVRFSKAGLGPITKTYKYDPTKTVQNRSQSATSAIPVKAKMKY